MIKPLNIATGGYLCNPLSISVDGYLCPSEDIEIPSGGNISYPTIGNKTKERKEKLKAIQQDDNEVLLMIKIFTKWL